MLNVHVLIIFYLGQTFNLTLSKTLNSIKFYPNEISFLLFYCSVIRLVNFEQ